MDRLQLTAVYCNRRWVVKTTPQMNPFFRDAKVCNNLATDENLRSQNTVCLQHEVQHPEGKKSTLGIAYAW